MDKTFEQWASALLGPNGKWGIYRELTPEQKQFIRESASAYDSGKFEDIIDYKDYTEHKLIYNIKHLFKKGGTE